MEPGIVENLRVVRAAIAECERISGRPSGSVEVVAVSKTHPAEVIREAVDAGQFLFGENRVQEAKAKIPDLPAKLRWHLIGHLQSNKIRQALPLFEMIHGVDSIELLDDIQRIAGELGLFPRVLLQVNVAGESSKFGFAPEQLLSQVERILRVKRVQIEGLMTIPPLAANPENSRKYFVALRQIRDRLEQEFRFPLPNLSMGMSGDYRVAVEEGATFVRVGTAIFGERKP
ncbi:MAG TPA: YggS family pyridoxal phosphate-dependent enzyme, partial [Chthoniobacterales bacterium]|nr:YggS family pyridoxal phosphate-dependent enzyme [Chthoniobacterales bacterium]